MILRKDSCWVRGFTGIDLMKQIDVMSERKMTQSTFIVSNSGTVKAKELKFYQNNVFMSRYIHHFEKMMLAF